MVNQRILFQKLIVVVMKYHHSRRIINHMGKDKIQNLQQALEEVQTDKNRSQEDIIEISSIVQEAYKDEEEYWHQKSRNMWYSAGDLNTKFYHALTKQRRIRNKIVGLHDEAGNWITDENGVEKVAVDYFDGLFSSTN